mmetsp:Transcript_29279/g.70663  ORF Transcript_29279/g.70663 Transcript_29279/m.70663 type:complete len:544 (-) Transcript_29279:133-1764(-)
MKLLVTINTGKVTRAITLPVGNGGQTFKWLAFAAAYRIVHDVNRYLPKKDPSALPVRTQLLPKNVYTEDCPFLHPYDVIKDHLSEGEQVIVDLYGSLELDEYGAPKLSPWAIIAFRHDGQHEEKRNSLIEEKKLEVETFRREKTNEAMIAKMEIEKPKISLMTVVMESQLISDDAIAATFNEEWALIKNSGILENIVPDDKQQDQIRGFLLKYFVELNDLYKFYSAVNSGGGTHTLEYIELSKFLTETGILGEEQHSNAVLRIFLDSHIGGRNRRRPSIHSEIYRHEFFVALIKISILRNITIPKKLRKKGHRVSISAAKLPSAPEALEMIYHEYLAIVLEKMPAGSKMRAAVGSESVMILFYDNLVQLTKCFEKYADDSGEEMVIERLSLSSGQQSSIPGGSMNVAEFSTFANDAGFVDSNVIVRRFSNAHRRHSIMGSRSSSSITQKDVRQIFSASQHDNAKANGSELQKVEDDDNLSSDQELMIFSEFLEAIARLGVLKYHTHPRQDDVETENVQREVLSHYECIKLAVEKVCSMTIATK